MTGTYIEKIPAIGLSSPPFLPVTTPENSILKNVITASVIALLIPFAGTAQAIIMNNSAPISYDPADPPAPAGMMDQNNTESTIGILLDYAEAFRLTVSPPAGINLYAMLTSIPGLSGTSTMNPDIYTTVDERSPVTFPPVGSYIQGSAYRLSLQPIDPSRLNGGPLLAGNAVASSTVQAPVAVCLFGGGLLGVIGVSRRRRNV